MPDLTIEWYSHNTTIVAITVLAATLMICFFGSLREEYMVEGRISKRWFGRLRFWLLWILR